MNIWFVRCNGETAHNQPGTGRYVPGEPPRWPAREFNYHDKCLEDGFARSPAAGRRGGSAFSGQIRCGSEDTARC